MAAAAQEEKEEFPEFTIDRQRSATLDLGGSSDSEGGGDDATAAPLPVPLNRQHTGARHHAEMVRAENQRLRALRKAARKERRSARRRWRAILARRDEAHAPSELELQGVYGLGLRFANIDVRLNELGDRLDALETARRDGQGGGRRRKSKRKRTKRHKRRKRKTRRRRKRTRRR